MVGLGLHSARFDLRERLGDGGGGVVYRAYDRSLERDVAVKSMRDVEGDGLARFRASFPALKAVTHPNLVELFDLVQEGKQTLLVMELVEGVDLLAYVRKAEGDVDELRLRSCFAQLAQGLRALHRGGKVHRDVKPTNVRVTAQGRVVLLDLDLGLDFDHKDDDDDVGLDARPTGTAVYMAPEQASSKPLSPASDWYAVGVALYEALTGALPFAGTDLNVLMAKQHMAPRPLSDFTRDAPPDLAALCLDLLRAEPRERPSGTEVLRRLGVPEGAGTDRQSLASLLSARSPFVGREHELARLSSALERSRDGVVVLRVLGALGVGKTRLCEEWFRRLERDDAEALLLQSRCAQSPDRPHDSLHGPVAQLIEVIKRMSPPPKLGLGAGALSLLKRMFGGAVLGVEHRASAHAGVPPDPVEQRFRAIAALVELLSVVCEQRPVVLWIDNYQRADVDTQRLIASLVRGRGAPRLLLLLSEDSDSDSLPSSLPTSDEIMSMTQLTPGDGARLAQELVSRTGGTEVPPELYEDPLPLMVQEQARYVLFFGMPPPLGLDLVALMEARIRALAPQAQLVLKVVALASDPVSQDVCERATALPRAEFGRHVSALRVGSLVRSTQLGGEDCLEPEHPLVTVAVDRQLQRAERDDLHGRLALSFMASRQPRAASRALRHQGESHDYRAAAESARLAAGEAAEALAFQRAAELYTLGVSLAPRQEIENSERYRQLTRMADALANAGWASSAASVYREAAELATAADALFMRQRALDYYVRAFQIDNAFEVVRELLALFSIATPQSARGAFWLLVWRRGLSRLRGFRFREVPESAIAARELRRVDALWASASHLSVVDALRGSELQTRALSAALQLGEPQRVARALCAEGFTLVGHTEADFMRAEATLETARELIAQSGSPLLDGQLRLASGVIDTGRLRLSDSLQGCRGAEQVFRDSCTDVARELSMARVHQLLCLLYMARFPEVETLVEQSASEAQERGDLCALGHFKCLGAVGIKLVRDLPNEAAADVARAEVNWGGGGRFFLPHLYALICGVYVDLYRGSARALDTLEAHWPVLRAQFLLQLRFVRTTLYELRARARILASLKRKDQALLRAAEADVNYLLSLNDPPEIGLGLLARASIHAVRQRRDACVKDLRAALPLLQQCQFELWSLAAGRMLGAIADDDEGARLHAEAAREASDRGLVNTDRYAAMMLPGVSQLLAQD